MDNNNSRPQRLQTIRELIIKKQIGNQADLLQELQEQGFPCTQATLSRDLALLKVRKATDPVGTRRYVLPRDERYRRVNEAKPHQQPQPVQFAGTSGFVSLNMSANIAVIRTRPGYAPSIAYHVDECHIQDVLGTIAGDDTVFCVIREGVSQEEIFAKLYAILK